MVDMYPNFDNYVDIFTCNTRVIQQQRSLLFWRQIQTPSSVFYLSTSKVTSKISPPLPTSTTMSEPLPATPTPKQRSRRRTSVVPKLAASDLTSAIALSKAVSIGRRCANSVPHSNDQSALLSGLLEKLANWAHQVSPERDLADFVVGAQAVGGNKELKGLVGNLRLAEFRQVDHAWREGTDERKKKRGKRKVVEEDDEGDEMTKEGEEVVAEERVVVEEEIVTKQVTRNEEIDMNDVMDMQEEIDMDVLDEMEDQMYQDRSNSKGRPVEKLDQDDMDILNEFHAPVKEGC